MAGKTGNDPGRRRGPVRRKVDDGSAPEEKGPKFGSGFEFVNEEPAEGSAAATAEPGAAESSAFGGLDGSEEDPFAALSALIPDSDAGEEAAMDSLQASLDSAMESINAELIKQDMPRDLRFDILQRIAKEQLRVLNEQNAEHRFKKLTSN